MIRLSDNNIGRGDFYFGNDVREGTKITKDEFEFLKSLSGRTIEELNSENSILVWPTSFNDTADDIKDQVLFHCTFPEDKSVVCTTHNLVGFVGDGTNQVEIRTRFSGDGNQRDYFLLHLLSVVFSCNIVDMKVGKGPDSALDLMMLLFAGLLTKAVNQGVYKKYVNHQYNDSNVRGTIDVSRHIRYNYPSNGRIAYSTREYSYDNQVTQLIRHTIEHIDKTKFGKTVLSAGEDVKKSVATIRQITPSYQKRDRRDVINANQKPVVHPYYQHYTALQRLCLSILKGEKMSYGDSKQKLSGFVIDMAWLWEEYVAKILARTGLDHFTRSNSKFHLFSKEDGQSIQKIIPDYYDEERRIVADAKYTDLSEVDTLSAERAAAIYYKTIMYMYRFNSTFGLLLYPTKSDDEIVKTEKYNIVGTDGYLHKIGIKIPIEKNKNYSDFSEKLNLESITEKITEYIK